MTLKKKWLRALSVVLNAALACLGWPFHMSYCQYQAYQGIYVGVSGFKGLGLGHTIGSPTPTCST